MNSNQIKRSIYYYEWFTHSHSSETNEVIRDKSSEKIVDFLHNLFEKQKIADSYRNFIVKTSQGEEFIIVDKVEESSISFRIVLCRENALPYIEKNGKLEGLGTYIDADQNIAEVTHCVFFCKYGILGAEYNNNGARATSITADMAEGSAFAHEHGVKVYVTVNILAHNQDLPGVREYLTELKELKPDALIIADPGTFTYAREICPEIECHISTQANNTNYETYRFWHRLGAKRVVTARELSLDEIREIRANIPDDMEIETFVHGAMCISYSGRCLLSNYLVGRDANQGACTHPCRWKYSIVEEKRPGEYMPVFENERGTYIFNSKDLCMIEHMDDILTCGIDSLKIEGRMKTALYVATVARTYRKAIDDYMESPEKYKANMSWYQEQISNCTYRQFTTGFFYGKPDENTQIYDNNTYVKEYTYLGYAEEVDEKGYAHITQRNKFSVGETVEIMKPDGQNLTVTVKAIYDEEGNSVESAPHPQQKLAVDLGADIEKYDLLRRSEA